MIRAYCARALAGVAVLLGLAAGNVLAQAEELRLAVTDVEGLERLQTEWGPFKAALEKASGLEFKFFPVNNRTAAAEALRAKKVDLVITGPAEYVIINKLTDAKPLIGFGRPDYLCAIVVMARSPYLRPMDLKGQKVAFKDVGSTSGHLCPMQLLADYGIAPMSDISRVHTSQNLQHEALKRGDVAAIGVNYNSWVSKARNKDTSVRPGDFRVIARSGDLPNDVLMIGAHVDSAVGEKISNVFIDHQNEIVAAITTNEENAKYEGMTFIKVVDKDYDIVRAMYGAIGHTQFAEFVGE